MTVLAKFIYKYYYKRSNSSEVNKIRKMLIGLNPGQNKDLLYENYYVKKISEMLTGLLAVVALLMLILIYDLSNSSVDEQGRIERANTDGKEYETELIANIGDEQININVTVMNQKYTEEEIEGLQESLFSKLDQIILGNNESFQSISENLRLVDSVDRYPFYIRWISSNYELLNENGVVATDNIDETGIDVDLNCVVTYEDYEYEKQYFLHIVPKVKTPLEALKDEVIASIQEMQTETQYKKYLQLPMSIGEKGIEWKESSKPTFAVVAILSFVALAGIWWGVDNDLTKKYEKRDQLLRTDYSEFVSKLQLLISSGMTLRGAFERMEADYKYAVKDGEKAKYVYEELGICLKRLRDGASESEVYIMFGNRCGQMSYKKLMSLLVQNLRKGSAGLIEALEYEAKVAFEERKHIARRLGDEAQTKLLFPMILMLSIVMIIILVPAYFSFAI